MTIRVPNPEVLKAGVKHAELDLNSWDQASWVSGGQSQCGTTACLAGHILLSQGYEWSYLLKNFNSISRLALDALGFEGHNNGVQGSDRRDFYTYVFGMVREGISNFANDPMAYETWVQAAPLKQEPAQFKYFKEKLTEITGIEL